MMLKKRLLTYASCAALALGLAACGKPADSVASADGAEAKVLNIYNWADYITDDMIANFEQETGIRVNYQTFETNEMLNTKLMAGNTGYDLVVPGAVFAKPQIEAGLYQALDKSLLPNWQHLDPAIMAKLAMADPGNAYLVPWGWSFVSVGINQQAVAKALGDMPLPANAWDLVFNPDYTSRLKSCGIAYLDTASEILPSALRYIGKPAYSSEVSDYQLAGEMLAKVRSDVRIFSSTMIDDLASGKACVGLGWAGDMNIARLRAKENQADFELEVLIPASGGILFFDNLAIPKDAKHVANAHAFINYFLRPEVSAELSNYLAYAVANQASRPLVHAEIANNPSTYLSEADLAKMVAPESFSPQARSAMTEVFTRFKKGQ